MLCLYGYRLQVHAPSPSTPQRILFLRPDAYGDLFLFEPVPRLVRDAWPQAEVAVLIREPYADVIPLLASGGVQWLTTACNPYRQGPGDDPAALDALRATVRAFAPDCVVAACSEQTWLESAVAAFLPGVRQVSLGPGLTDPLIRAALDAVLPVDWAAIYPEKIRVEPEEPEWEKNLRLAGALLGREAPRWWPTATVPADAGKRAARIVASVGLPPGNFLVCAVAGIANVPIKSWPAARYGETLAWLEREHGVRALLIGHASEHAPLEAARAAACAAGANPALWVGKNGEMPVVAGLLAAARFYFGNDTGALHLAAALGTPVVPVFGGGHWPRFRPVARRSLTVVQPLPCFGCAWDCYFVDAPCVRTISVASVQRALAQFLADDADKQAVFEAEGLEAGARALIETATPRLRLQREDSAARLRQTREMGALLAASETDRDARLKQVDELSAQLHGSEAESLARLRQVEELTTGFQATEIESTARQGQITKLTALLKTSETDRDAREKQVAKLSALLKTSEADRADRQDQITKLSALLKTSETDRDAREKQVAKLSALLKTSEADRADRQDQITKLSALLKTSEADRAARGEQIQTLTSWLLASNAENDALREHVAALSSLLPPGEADPKASLADQAAPGTIRPTEAEASDKHRLLTTSELTTVIPSGTPLPGGVRHGKHERFS